MKKAMLALGILLILSAGLSAQVPQVPNSILGQVTGGLYLNELDAAANINEGLPGPDFSKLENTYIFGALDNLGQYLTVSSVATLPWIGVYLPGKMPLSIFDRLALSGTPADPTKAVVETTANKNVTVGTVTTTYLELTERQTTTSRARLFTALDEAIRANIALGALNLSAAARVNITDASDPALNTTILDEFFYDTTAAGVAPVVAPDYAETTVAKALDITGDYAVEFGAFTKTGNLWHDAVLSLAFNTVDTSSGGSYTMNDTPSDPTAPASNYLNTTSKVTNFLGTINIDLNYRLSMPGKTKDEDARTYLGLNLGADLGTANLSTTNTSAFFTYAAGGNATPVAGAIGDTNITRDLGAALGLSVEALAGQYLYFKPATSLQIGFKPEASLGYSLANNGSATISGRTTVTRVDGDGNQIFTDPGDLITTTRITYTGQVVDNTGTPVTKILTNSITCGLSVPVGAIISVPKMPFQIIMGATPSLDYSLNFVSTSPTTTVTTTEVRTGAGGVVGTDTVVNTQGTGSSTMQNVWTPGLRYDLGLHIDLGDNTDLDLRLGGLGLTAFTSMSVQLIFALK